MSELSWARIRVLVYERARGCCEYCQTCEVNTGITMQVDHIIPDGNNALSNLCLACWNCNNHKQQATHFPDPLSGEEVVLFNPRTQKWAERFKWIDNATRLEGLTASGRATIARLKMNRPILVHARGRWIQGNFHPPDFS